MVNKWEELRLIPCFNLGVVFENNNIILTLDIPEGMN